MNKDFEMNIRLETFAREEFIFHNALRIALIYIQYDDMGGQSCRRGDCFNAQNIEIDVLDFEIALLNSLPPTPLPQFRLG